MASNRKARAKKNRSARGSAKARKKAKPRRAGTRGRPPLGTQDWTIPFLNSISDGSHARDAAKDAKVHGNTPYRRRAEDPVFAEAWAEAKKIGRAELEAEAKRRAYHGTKRPVYHGGKVVGHIREYSDRLLMFLLRAEDPDKYAKLIKQEHSGPDGAPIPIAMLDVNSDDFKALPPEERIRRLREAVEAKRKTNHTPAPV